MARTCVQSVRMAYTFISAFIVILDVKPFGGLRATRGQFGVLSIISSLLGGPNRNIAGILLGIVTFAS